MALRRYVHPVLYKLLRTNTPCGLQRRLVISNRCEDTFIYESCAQPRVEPGIGGLRGSAEATPSAHGIYHAWHACSRCRLVYVSNVEVIYQTSEGRGRMFPPLKGVVVCFHL